jgi:hypothetical protein
MGFETKENSGSLFKNDRRQHDNQPNAKGKALIGGAWYWVAAWTKQGRDGQPFQSLSFEEMTPDQVAKYTGGGTGQAGAAAGVSGGGRAGQGGGGNGYRGQPRQQAAPPPARGGRQADPPFGGEQEFQDASIPF